MTCRNVRLFFGNLDQIFKVTGLLKLKNSLSVPYDLNEIVDLDQTSMESLPREGAELIIF